MKRFDFSGRSVGRALLVAAFVATLALLGCDNSMSFNPTTPEFPRPTPIGERSLDISGTLEAEGSACREATILFDGEELPNARVRCARRRGCFELTLAASTSSSSGRHTISFQVLEQSAPAVKYVAQGNVLVARDGIRLPGVNMLLGPKSATLGAGESVSFEVDFTD